MCTGLEILAAVGSVVGIGSQVMQMSKADDVPELPAAPADPKRAPGATVRVGDLGAVDGNGENQPADGNGFKETRVSGKALGGLGRGGLGL